MNEINSVVNGESMLKWVQTNIHIFLYITALCNLLKGPMWIDWLYLSCPTSNLSRWLLRTIYDFKTNYTRFFAAECSELLCWRAQIGSNFKIKCLQLKNYSCLYFFQRKRAFVKAKNKLHNLQNEITKNLMLGSPRFNQCISTFFY